MARPSTLRKKAFYSDLSRDQIFGTELLVYRSHVGKTTRTKISLFRDLVGLNSEYDRRAIKCIILIV